MDCGIAEIAERIREMREILGISREEMADGTGLSLEDYIEYESGRRDFSFSLLFSIANRFGIDITELITGDVPKLSRFCLVRREGGLPIERRKGFSYRHLAHLFKEREMEPFRVVAKYDAELENAPIVLSSHEGHEFDYVLSGRLRLRIEDHEMELSEGDSIFYDAKNRHGMIAVGGGDCVFLAVISSSDEYNKGY